MTYYKRMILLCAIFFVVSFLGIWGEKGIYAAWHFLTLVWPLYVVGLGIIVGVPLVVTHLGPKVVKHLRHVAEQRKTQAEIAEQKQKELEFDIMLYRSDTAHYGKDYANILRDARNEAGLCTKEFLIPLHDGRIPDPYFPDMLWDSDGPTNKRLDYATVTWTGKDAGGVLNLYLGFDRFDRYQFYQYEGLRRGKIDTLLEQMQKGGLKCKIDEYHCHREEGGVPDYLLDLDAYTK